MAIIGLCQFFLDLQWIPQVRVPASTFGHKNVAMHYIMMTLPAGIAILLTTHNRIKNALYGFSVSLVLLYVFVSYTRAAWVVLLCMSILLSVFLMVDYRNKKISPVWYAGKSVPVLAGIIVGLFLLNIQHDTKNFSSAFQHMAGATQSIYERVSDNNLQKSVIDNSLPIKALPLAN